MMLLFWLFYGHSSDLYLCMYWAKKNHTVYWCCGSYLWDICVLVLVVFSIISGALGTAVYRNFSSFHKSSHCCIFQTFRTFAVMFCVFDLRYLQLQQNLFMLSIKKCHTLPLACHLLARRRPPTFFISWVGCVDICVSWSIRLRYPIESKRNCIYTTLKKTSDVKKCWEHVLFFISCLPVSSMFFEK